MGCSLNFLDFPESIFGLQRETSLAIFRRTRVRVRLFSDLEPHSERSEASGGCARAGLGQAAEGVHYLFDRAIVWWQSSSRRRSNNTRTSNMFRRKQKKTKPVVEDYASDEDSDNEAQDVTKEEDKKDFMFHSSKVKVNKQKNCVSCNISIPEKAARCYSCHADQPIDHLNVSYPVVMDKDTRYFKRYRITIADEDDETLKFDRYVFKLKDKYLINALSGYVSVSRLPRKKKHRAWVHARDVVVALPSIRAFIAAGNATPAFVQFVEGVERIQVTMVKQIRALVKQSKIVFDGLYWLFESGQSIASFFEDELLGSIIKSSSYAKGFLGDSFSINATSVKSNGECFYYHDHTVQVHEFDGVKACDGLAVRLLPEDVYTELTRRGRRFQEIALGHHYQQYRGALVRKGGFGKDKVKADGRIMVDVQTYNRMNTRGDTSYTYTSPTAYQYTGNSMNDPSLLKTLDEDELFMTWPFLPGFSFQTKQWGEFFVRRITEIAFDTEAFRDLVLPQDKKSLIRALVDDHRITMEALRRQTAEQEAKDRIEATRGCISRDTADPRRNKNVGFTDIIAGKGGGCIFLLHGTPGVGKTLTAEAVSEHLQIPLYVVSVGELGTTPQSLETSLQKILELAQAWGCSLLLDEADVFLEKRNRADIVRNAMVGVFLRTLEYYQGVLFLTTNRLECLDDAFSSRISVALHYNELDRSARAKVWSNFLGAARRLRAQCADGSDGSDGATPGEPIEGALEEEPAAAAPEFDIEALAQHKLNGRQIRSCVQISQALARTQDEALSMKHLLTTIGVSLNFRRQFKKIGDVNGMTGIAEDHEEEEVFLNMFQNCDIE
eukprot:TRINITY_DN266_c0_g1_i1.p1 TRINITY_DN266_c0_g1~~TRINITY_DN266_c0_g1_i1.p1  ORF type:complete len:836 (+),score=353.79 TRINITY_DN266_c0_g1_i1:250-2757(+)